MISMCYERAWLPLNDLAALPAVAARTSRQRTGFTGADGVVLGAPHANGTPADKPPYGSAPERCP